MILKYYFLIYFRILMGCVASKTKTKNLELKIEKLDTKMEPNKRRKVKPYLLKRLQRQLNAKTKILKATRTKLKKQTEKCEIYSDEWQDCIEDIEESQHCESVFQSLGEFMLFLMGNEGLRHIADKIFGASEISYIYAREITDYMIDMVSLANCRLVSRAFRDYLDNHMSMLHLQIKHFRDFRAKDTEDCGAWKENTPHRDWVDYGVFDFIEKEVKDVSKLRTFLGLLREISSDLCHALIEDPFRCLVDNHMHKELQLLMNSPLPIYPPWGWGKWVAEWQDWPSYIFLYACTKGCGICVQTFLDHVGEKFIDVNWTRRPEHKDLSCMHAALENDFFKGQSGEHRYRKRVLPVLLRNASDKGIDMNAIAWHGMTVKERVIDKYKWDMKHWDDADGHLCTYAFGPDEYEVYEMLGINTDDYPAKEEGAATHSDSNSNSTSSLESNWATVSDTDTDPDA